MMCVSEFSLGEYITLSISFTNEPFPLRKDGPRAFPPSTLSASVPVARLSIQRLQAVWWLASRIGQIPTFR
jgi:hypothetical protein